MAIERAYLPRLILPDAAGASPFPSCVHFYRAGSPSHQLHVRLLSPFRTFLPPHVRKGPPWDSLVSGLSGKEVIANVQCSLENQRHSTAVRRQRQNIVTAIERFKEESMLRRPVLRARLHPCAICLTDNFCSSFSRSTSDNFRMDNFSLAIFDSFLESNLDHRYPA